MLADVGEAQRRSPALAREQALMQAAYDGALPRTPRVALSKAPSTTTANGRTARLSATRTWLQDRIVARNSPLKLWLRQSPSRELFVKPWMLLPRLGASVGVACNWLDIDRRGRRQPSTQPTRRKPHSYFRRPKCPRGAAINDSPSVRPNGLSGSSSRTTPTLTRGMTCTDFCHESVAEAGLLSVSTSLICHVGIVAHARRRLDTYPLKPSCVKSRAR